MSPVVKIFMLDGLSKCILALTTFGIIRVLPVEQYARFTLMFTSVLMGYQTLCGLIERLYISDASEYSTYGRKAFALTLAFTSLLLAVYLLGHVSLADASIGLFVFLVCTHYQFQRIKLQRESRFFAFMMIDFGRNGLWLLCTALLCWWGQLDAWTIMGGYAVSAMTMAMIHRQGVMQTTCADVGTWHESARYLFERRALLGYCALAGLAPYLSLLMISQQGSSYQVASYGAALRYQSIFAMFVYALNAVLIVRFTAADAEVQAMITAFYKRLPLLLGCLALFAGLVAWFIPWVDGGKYATAPLLFLLLAGCSIASLIATPSVNYLLSRRHYVAMLKSILLGVSVMLVLGTVLARVDSHYGIMVGVLLGYIAIAVFNIAHCRRLVQCDC